MTRDPAVPATSDAGVRVQLFAADTDLSWVVGLLTERRDEILARWVDAASDQPFHRSRSQRAVADDIPRLFDALIGDLATRGPGRHEPVPLEDPAVLAAAQSHARARFQQGFSPPEIATEFRLLRQEVGRALRHYLSDRSPTSDVVGAELLLHDALDGAVFLALTTLDAHEAARREAEAALRATEERYRLLVESVQDYAIYTLTADGVVASWNAGAERIFRHRPDDILGHPYAAFFDEPDLAAGKPQQLLALAAAEGRATDHGPRRRADGSRFQADAVLIPLRSAERVLVGFADITRDLTERSEIEAERVSLGLEREALFSTLAHDLKSPLASASAVIQLLHRRLLREPAVEPGLVERLSMAEAALRRTALRIDELMDLARRQDVAPERRPGPTDLVALAREVVALYRMATDGHDLELEAASESLVGSWERARLERVVDNLLSNAVKFSPSGGRIQLSLREERDEEGRWATLAVRDEGLGIPQSELGAIFERFRRGRNAREVPGSGIGLWSVRRIVEEHGGTVAVTSEEGAGSLFTIRLPLPTTATADDHADA